MGLNLNKILFVTLLLGVTSVRADIDKKHYTISKMKVSEVERVTLGQSQLKTLQERSITPEGLPQDGQPSRTDKVGKVISVARDLVALGEDVYRLVIKGKPSNTSSYAPIRVIPRVNGAAVDMLDTEGWSAPVKRTYQIDYENLYGITVVSYRYSIIYSYNGSYDGKGAYLTAVQIVPENVRTLFGFDFTATMKLGGIQNQGTKAYPIAGATILMEYTVSSIMVANSQVDSYFITGRGGFKSL
jgi:hypothetical protein